VPAPRRLFEFPKEGGCRLHAEILLPSKQRSRQMQVKQGRTIAKLVTFLLVYLIFQLERRQFQKYTAGIFPVTQLDTKIIDLLDDGSI